MDLIQIVDTSKADKNKDISDSAYEIDEII